MSDTPQSELEAKWAAQIDARSDSDVEAASESGDEPEGDAAGELRGQIAELNDRLLRQKAEMANFRRRMERDHSERQERGRADVIDRLLPVLDDFERALEVEPDNADAYRAGVELILRSFREVLDGFDVTRIDPLGEPFDPQFHDAVDRVETEELDEGRVAEVYQPGYMHGERLLRPARVAVAAAPRRSDA